MAEAQGIELLGHSDLGGDGDGMQVMLKDDHLFVGRMRPGRPMLILNVANPRRPEIVGAMPAYPGTWHTKCQISGNLMLVNYEQRGSKQEGARSGFAVFDITKPAEPRELTYVNTGAPGVHRIWWDGGRYCYVSGQPVGLAIYDLQRPESPEMVGRWWQPGLWQGGPVPPAPPADAAARASLHHGIAADGLLYCGRWPGGIVILNVDDPTEPVLVKELIWGGEEGGNSHTALPLPNRGLLAVTDESIHDDCQEAPKLVRIFDISDPANPRLLSKWRPDPDHFCSRGGRFGPHNLHENRPGSFQSEELLFVTFFNAGLQVLDIKDPENPRASAFYIPDDTPGVGPCQSNDVLVTADGRIFLTDRAGGGLHILQLQ